MKKSHRKAKMPKSVVKRHVVADIKDEIDDEKTYRKQARTALTKADRKTLLGIARDEADHRKKLRRIEKRLKKKHSH